MKVMRGAGFGINPIKVLALLEKSGVRGFEVLSQIIIMEINTILLLD